MNFQETILKAMLFCSVNINRSDFFFFLSSGTDFLGGGKEGLRKKNPKASGADSWQDVYIYGLENFKVR